MESWDSTPARHKVFAALNLDPSGQPPPGLTTPLPHHWEKGLDDGTGMGEDAPMERHDVPGGVFLRPMRIMSSSEYVELEVKGGDFELSSPPGDWPGTVYGGLVRVHWELLINIERTNGGRYFGSSHLPFFIEMMRLLMKTFDI